MSKHTSYYLWKTFMRWGSDFIVRFDEHRGCFVRDGAPLGVEVEIR